MWTPRLNPSLWTGHFSCRIATSLELSSVPNRRSIRAVSSGVENVRFTFAIQISLDSFGVDYFDRLLRQAIHSGEEEVVLGADVVLGDLHARVGVELADQFGVDVVSQQRAGELGAEIVEVEVLLAGRIVFFRL